MPVTRAVSPDHLVGAGKQRIRHHDSSMSFGIFSSAMSSKYSSSLRTSYGYFFLRDELVDLDCALALDGDCLKLFWLNLGHLAIRWRVGDRSPRPSCA
jgi:hypothetical protein